MTDNKEKAYIGETSNSLPTRMEDHLEAFSQAMRLGRRQEAARREGGRERGRERGRTRTPAHEWQTTS